MFTYVYIMFSTFVLNQELNKLFIAKKIFDTYDTCKEMKALTNQIDMYMKNEYDKMLCNKEVQTEYYMCNNLTQTDDGDSKFHISHKFSQTDDYENDYDIIDNNLLKHNTYS